MKNYNICVRLATDEERAEGFAIVMEYFNIYHIENGILYVPEKQPVWASMLENVPLEKEPLKEFLEYNFFDEDIATYYFSEDF